MINFKVSGLAAGGAFFLSLFIGIFSRSSMPMLILRPIIFAVLFFLIPVLVSKLVSIFIPELLEENHPQTGLNSLGANIDITEGDSAPSTVQAFMGARADDSEEGLGNISDLVDSKEPPDGENPASMGMDQNVKDDYNGAGGIAGSSVVPEADSSFPWEPPPGMSARPVSPPDLKTGEKPVIEQAAKPEKKPSAALPGGISNGESVDALPDLDSIAGAFLPSASDGETETVEYTVTDPSPKKSSGKAAPEWAGDFNARDMAKGLQTILKKEKEGQ